MSNSRIFCICFIFGLLFGMGLSIVLNEMHSPLTIQGWALGAAAWGAMGVACSGDRQRKDEK